MSPRVMLMLGATSGFLSVAFGAFGAHGLKHRVGPDLLAIFHTGVDYQALHAIALLACGLLALHRPSRSLGAAGWCFVVGSLIFSGSLYVLTLTGLRWLGAITPIGGVAFLIGWACLIYAAWQFRQTPHQGSVQGK